VDAAVIGVPRTMTAEGMMGLAEALRGPAGTAFVLAGAGSAFCLGADLKWLGGLPDPGEGVARLVAGHHEVVRAMRTAPVPVITAVNGAAAGGGMSLALAADYVIAGPEASFTAAYFRLGLTPDGGNSAFLTSLLGAGRAMGLLLTNRTLRAQEALGWGLVAEVADDPVSRACALANEFARVPAETLVTARRLLWPDLDVRLDEEAAAVAAAAQRAEFRDALADFLSRH
jgi:2-(1,2-epoxy-1,2-dihydrophenyl)acetyl-CoA isomerase